MIWFNAHPVQEQFYLPWDRAGQLSNSRIALNLYQEMKNNMAKGLNASFHPGIVTHVSLDPVFSYYDFSSTPFPFLVIL